MRVDISAATTVDTRSAAQAAEAAGYAGVWTGEVTHDPLMGLALAATVTSEIELGTSIALAFARNPMSLAIQANDIQELSGGRLVLGLGSQVKAHITRRFGMPWSAPAARMREYVLAMRSIFACWHNEEKLDFNGEFYTHNLTTPFFQPSPNAFGAPRILLAAVGDRMTQVTGEVADGILLHGFTTEKYLRDVTLPAIAVGRGRAAEPAPDFEVAGMPFVVTGSTTEDKEEASRAVRDQIAFYASTPAYRPVLELHGWGELGDRLHAMSRNGGWADMADAIDDDVLDAFAVVAEPDQVATELLARFGDTMTRMRLYTPYRLDDDARWLIETDLKAATS